MVHSFLSEPEIEALRTIFLEAKADKGRRHTIIQEADVEAHDFDNFLNVREVKDPKKDGSRKIFRSKFPNNSFQRRLVNYLFSESALAEQLLSKRKYSMDDGEIAHCINILKDKMVRSAKISDDDYQFNLMRHTGAITEKICKEICYELEGDYELYRLSISKDLNNIEVHKSKMRIFSFDIYQKVPRFINRIALGGNKDRTIIGNITLLGSSLLFSGLVLGKKVEKMKDVEIESPQPYIGSKVMVLNKYYDGRDVLRFSGFSYTSQSDERYEIGATLGIKTKTAIDIFDKTEIGIFSIPLSQITQMEPNASLENSSISVRDIALELPTQLLADGRLFGPITFDMRNRARSSQRRAVTRA